MENETQTFQNFADFYPFYLNEHKNRVSRRLHFIGTAMVIGLFIFALFTGIYLLLLLMPVAAYGFAWVGHFFFEKNKPATFRYPFYSLIGDFNMFRDIITGKIRL
jgi:hypothetical protein